MGYRQIEPDKIAALRLDGLPRVIRAVDEAGEESLHVFELVGETLRSTIVSAWAGPLPTDPTPEQIADAIAARAAAEQQARQDAAALRQQVLTVAQSAVGVPFDQLTAAQLRALFGVVLRKEGALDKDGKVRPLAEWVK